MTLRITTTGSGGINEVAPGVPERAFAALYSQVFANAGVGALVRTKGLGAAPEETPVVINGGTGEVVVLLASYVRPVSDFNELAILPAGSKMIRITTPSRITS